MRSEAKRQEVPFV